MKVVKKREINNKMMDNSNKSNKFARNKFENNNKKTMRRLLLLLILAPIMALCQEDCKGLVGIVSYQGKETDVIEIGKDAYFSLYIYNNTQQDAKNIKAVIPIPKGSEFGMAITNNGKTSNSEDELLWEIPSLPGGNYMYMTLILRAKKICVDQDVLFLDIDPRGKLQAEMMPGGEVVKNDFISGKEAKCRFVLDTKDSKAKFRFDKIEAPSLNTTLEYCPTTTQDNFFVSSRIIKRDDTTLLWYEKENDKTPLKTEPRFTTKVEKRTVHTYFVSQKDNILGCESNKTKVEVVIDDNTPPRLNLPQDLVVYCPDLGAINKINSWIEKASAFDMCWSRAEVKNDFVYTPDMCDRGQIEVTFSAKDKFENLAQEKRKIIFKEKNKKEPENDSGEKKCVIGFPNMFTPNGDGVNDVFRIRQVECFANNSFSVYNRWGKEVFFAKNYDNVNVVFKGYDRKGRKLPEGIYYYQFLYRLGKYEFSEKGWFTFSW